MNDIRSGANKRVFRFEALQTYTVDDEAEDFEAFLRGEKPSADDMQSWIEIIQGNEARGVAMVRVRRICWPITDYTRFEIEWGYKFSQPAGEDIRFIDDEVYKTLFPSDFVLDYWLIDESIAYILIYDEVGRHVTNIRLAENLGYLVDHRNKIVAKSKAAANHSVW